jgi:acyl-CoA synthetase (AMP-forming)/AMP-acid ligase II
MPRFDAARWLQLAQHERITHTMLVPVQYRRLLEHAAFDGHDLSSLQMKFCTSAPFSADLKREVLRRMPGGLVEFYGMTEGGGTCILEAHRHPDKLHTVGKPSAGHDIRLIDEEGQQVWPRVNDIRDGAELASATHATAAAATVTGEVVGRSPAMMTGYHGQPHKTREAEWYDDQGQRFIRTGDVGRFDEDGFLILFDRRKDMVISGGFNLYPSDLEALLTRHPAVAEAAVVGVASARWGETPVAWVVRRSAVQHGGAGSADGMAPSEAELLEWFNIRCGKTQRLAGVAFIDELPRSAIGKVLKRELRLRWKAPVQ